MKADIKAKVEWQRFKEYTKSKKGNDETLKEVPCKTFGKLEFFDRHHPDMSPRYIRVSDLTDVTMMAGKSIVFNNTIAGRRIFSI